MNKHWTRPAQKAPMEKMHLKALLFCNHTGWRISLLLIKSAGRREPQSLSSGIWGSHTSDVGSNLKTEGLAPLQSTKRLQDLLPSTAVTVGDKLDTSSCFELAGWEGLCGGQAAGKAPGPVSSDDSACSSLNHFLFSPPQMTWMQMIFSWTWRSRSCTPVSSAHQALVSSQGDPWNRVGIL